MRKYFTKDGDFKKGPFNLDQLKLEKINTNTPIWFEELGEWVTAGEVEELEECLQAKNVSNMFTGFATSNNFNQQLDINNNYALALSNNKVGYRNSMSLSILVYGLLIIVVLIMLSKS
jgi:GYF domain 2